MVLPHLLGLLLLMLTHELLLLHLTIFLINHELTHTLHILEMYNHYLFG